MIKKILIIIFTTYALTVNVIASDDGELTLKKNEIGRASCRERV